MAITADKIWFDGELVDFEAAQVHVLTHTLHYGLGAFEGIRCYERADGRAAIFRLDEHIERLIESCHICTIQVPWSREQLAQACKEVVRANKFTDCYIRPLVFYGSEGMGIRADNLKVHVAVAAWYWGAYMGDEALEQGIRIRGFLHGFLQEGFGIGRILRERRGSGGHGYDPVFLDPVHGQTAAEMPLELKNGLSHRGQALVLLRERLSAISADAGDAIHGATRSP